MIFEVQLADPSRQSERATYTSTVEQAVLADRLGFDGVWAAEHHDLRYYAHCTAPEVLLSTSPQRRNGFAPNFDVVDAVQVRRGSISDAGMSSSRTRLRTARAALCIDCGATRWPTLAST
jgi:Luciferase-like monooxygenase